jgi:hypothetical protein
MRSALISNTCLPFLRLVLTAEQALIDLCVARRVVAQRRFPASRVTYVRALRGVMRQSRCLQTTT